MSILTKAVVSTGRSFFSRSLQRQISTITSTALVQIDAAGNDLRLSSVPGSAKPPAELRDLVNAMVKPGALVDFQRVEVTNAAAGWLAEELGVAGDGLEADAANWILFACRFEDGSVDHVALRLEGGQHDAHCADIVSAIWPVLREDCLRDLSGQSNSAVNRAMLWTISTKADSAVLVLDAAGRLLDCNDSGRDILDGGTLLQDHGGVLRCVNGAETKAFYEAVRACAEAPPDDNREMIIFLEEAGGSHRLPVSLTRYSRGVSDVPMVVAILPRQPDRSRIEMLAQKMGLSPAEARVAALIQLGLSNREAAHIAGLKEQTFNTYAKRALSKLDVACRTEMAQRLTWQASLGRAS